MDHGVNTIDEQLENILSLSDELLRKEYEAQIPSNLTPPVAFWSGYNEKQIKYGLQSCLPLWIASFSVLIPREFQLRAIISTMSAQDSFIDVGTGNGKTLCMIIPCLLSPKTISVVISPLKQLQISDRTYSALIVQPEQLFMNNGHMPRLARLVSQNCRFNRLIKRLHVDEAHFIYSAGLDHYGLPAFRSAWGKLGEFRIKLGKDIIVKTFRTRSNGLRWPACKSSST